MVFSFHANKNLTTIEGAAVSVATPEEAKRLEVLRFHGITKFPDGTMDVTEAASKHNMTDVAARVGIGQLAHLDEFNKKRRALAYRYLELLGDEELGRCCPPRATPATAGICSRRCRSTSSTGWTAPP